jgi:adenylylsulfate kinase
VTVFISPFGADRDNVRKIGGADFHQNYCPYSLEVSEDRDLKGMYKRVRAGGIPEFTGINSPYEEAEFGDLTINTESHLDECSRQFFCYLAKAMGI